MYVHGAPKRRVRRPGIHDAQNAMDYLVAADAKDGDPKYLVRVGVDGNLDNVSPFSTARASLLIGRLDLLRDAGRIAR
jgi:hypothetical protein